VTLQQYFCLFFFDNPTHKTKTGITNRRETTNSKAPGPIMAKGAESRRIYYTPFWQVLLGCAVLLLASANNATKKNVGPKPFCLLSQTGMF
jgi:hypothetical protein